MMNRFDPPDSPGYETTPEIGDALDENLVTIPCYEPAGATIEISGRALVTHTLLLGQTGSGKTSVMRWYLKDLIQRHPADHRRKAGIFIFDLNADDTPDMVQQWAQEAGRASDLRFLTSTRSHLELFAHVHSLEDIPCATAQFMNGRWTEDADNGYWNETTRALIDAALSLCFIVEGRLDTDITIRFLTNWLVAKRPTAADEALLVRFEAMLTKAEEYLDKHLLGKLQHVRATVEMWTKLDLRTRSILASCLLDALGGLISMETRRYLDQDQGSSFRPEDIVDGRILVFSIPAARHRESASLLSRLIKARLYLALQDRVQDRNQRVCAVLADEYHFLASGGTDRSSDVVALATLRSRSVAIIAATQSLHHLAAVMGPQDFRSLIPNIGNFLFFRSTEESTGALATSMMGTQGGKLASEDAIGDLVVAPTKPQPREWVCPPGALTQLQPCQAYVALSNGFRSPGMLWLAGQHEPPRSKKAASRRTASKVDSLQSLREATSPNLKAVPAPPLPSFQPEIAAEQERFAPEQPLYYGYEAWSRLLGERRFQKTTFARFRDFRQTFANHGLLPAGLDTIPICWWGAVAKLTLAFAHKHPMKLLGLHQVDGCFQIMISDTSGPLDIYLAWIAQLQGSVYPVRTRPLKRRDVRILGDNVVNDEINFEDFADDEDT